MTVPSTNIQLANDVFAEANGGYSGNVKLFELGYESYFVGPNGANTIAYNAWGRGVNSGDDRIYQTTATTNNININDFAGLTYFYDNSTFQVTLNVTNNLPFPNVPPDPPDLNDINVNITLYDSSVSYSYITGGGLATSNGGTFGPSDISQTTSPIIFRGYWEVNIQGQNPSFGGGSADLSINGNSKFTAQAVAGGPGGSTFIFSSFSTEDVASFGGFTGLYFDVTVF